MPGKLTDDLQWVSVHRSSIDPRVSDTAAWALACETAIGAPAAAEAVDLLIEGSVGCSTAAGGRGDLTASEILGLEGALQGVPSTRRTWAHEPSQQFYGMYAFDELIPVQHLDERTAKLGETLVVIDP
ncbi:MAG: hypothetical protein F4X11_01795 [Acidobacteria bacterium]|nr:hypothetical protein [Acidobacteriota bacterium]